MEELFINLPGQDLLRGGSRLYSNGDGKGDLAVEHDEGECCWHCESPRMSIEAIKAAAC